MNNLLAWLLVGLLGLVACAPSSAPPEQPWQAADEAVLTVLRTPFVELLQTRGITLGVGQAFRYEGSDERVFLQVIDQFYRQHPGFCPVERGFAAAPDRPLYITLAANGLDVRALVYDQSRKPKLSFSFIQGSSLSALPTTPCRTVL
jgi:hypothetical protein